eukprot:scaffold85971_cov43-Tisochrysis_lutea.AAC.5
MAVKHAAAQVRAPPCTLLCRPRPRPEAYRPAMALECNARAKSLVPAQAAACGGVRRELAGGHGRHAGSSRACGSSAPSSRVAGRGRRALRSGRCPSRAVVRRHALPPNESTVVLSICH